MSLFIKLSGFFALVCALALGGLASMPVSVFAADEGFADCGTTPTAQPGQEQITNIKCQSQLFGARCFFPTAGGSCQYEDSIIGVLIDFLIFLGPFIAVLVVLYGGYLFYFASFGGSADAGRKAVTAGVSGLIVIVLLSGFKLWILSFGSKNGVKFDNLSEQIVEKILIPTFGILQVGAAAFALMSIVYAGYWYIFGSSQGPQGVKRGLSGLKNAVIGVILVLLSVTIVALLSNFIRSFK
jgi:hypothetical protein